MLLGTNSFCHRNNSHNFLTTFLKFHAFLMNSTCCSALGYMQFNLGHFVYNFCNLRYSYYFLNKINEKTGIYFENCSFPIYSYIFDILYLNSFHKTVSYRQNYDEKFKIPKMMIYKFQSITSLLHNSLSNTVLDIFTGNYSITGIAEIPLVFEF